MKSKTRGVRPGVNQHDLVVHDNVIHGDTCSAINFATVDPSQGAVSAFNNVIFDVGAGPEPSDGEASAVGIYVPGYTYSGPDGRGEVFVWQSAPLCHEAPRRLPAARTSASARRDRG